jgi:hypothetical protein
MWLQLAASACHHGPAIGNISFSNIMSNTKNSKNKTLYNSDPSLYGGKISVNKKRKKLVSNGVKPSFDSNSSDNNEIQAEPIIGTNQSIAKDYYRLTSAPTPQSVRPEGVLKKSLSAIQQKWKSEAIDYSYACNQLKSIRQDLTVQHIRNPFTVQCYETHARIAIESGDYGEFAQCQSQLHQLYQEICEKHAKSKSQTNIDTILPNKAEFHAYKILQYLFYQREHDLHLINFIEHHLTAQDKANPFIQYSINCRNATISNNYKQFFALYTQAPVMCGYLLDSTAERMRLKALTILATAYRPNLSLNYITKILAFDSVDECLQYCVALNLLISTESKENYLLDTKLSAPILQTLLNNKSQQQQQTQANTNQTQSSNTAVELTLQQKLDQAMGGSSNSSKKKKKKHKKA